MGNGLPDGERRLAAIMFTDMVGYTALGQRNESLSLALVEEQRKLIRPILSRHNGREIKTIGDAFLVEFPNALDAMRCAYDIQRATKEYNISLPAEARIHLRVGLHLGDVVDSHGDISGDAVNVASRIEPLAEDGGVCLTRQVFDQVKGKFELPHMSLGSKVLKNVSEPIEVFKVVMPWEASNPVDRTVLFPSNRLAVLPFVSISPDPNDEYFADGLTEEMIGRLSLMNGLEVIARTSVMTYKKKDKTASQIGRELGVGTLLEGSVRKAGNRIRVTAQLINANTEGHMWMENYDRSLEDIFAVQSEVAERVADSLQLRFTAEDRKRVARGETQNPEAHTQYLKGRTNLWHIDGNSLRAAIGYFERALERDPSYALAYCGLSNAYWFLALVEIIEPKEAILKAEWNARKALELDQNLAEAHAALYGPLTNNYDFKGAEAELTTSLELNPNLAEAYGWLAALYLLNGRRDKCLETLEQVERLNPLAAQTSGQAGTMFLYAGQYDRAIRHLKNALEFDPDSSLSLDNLGLAHIQKGLVQEGLAEIKRATEMGSSFSSDLAYAYAKVGKLEEARRLLTGLLERGRNEYVPATIVAGVYAVLDDREKALDWLERAYSERSGYLPWTRIDFVFERIWKEPRYLALIEKMGLAQLPQT
jgi:TolB-like protein/Flp pilus assembly protein TadD